MLDCPHKMQEFTSFDGDRFSYRSFGTTDEASTIIIGVHGISGASYDYIGLGEYLEKHHPGCALYAYEVRGQGLDPNQSRIGDIHRPQEWYQDLYAFTRLVRDLHPKARIIWCGESMGSLITLHAYAARLDKPSLCDGLILLAPVVKIGNQIPSWKLNLARLVSWMFPRFRVKLDQLHDDETVKVTQGSDSHSAQSSTNEWHIESYTLRLLSILGAHIRGMMQQAKHITHPVLILNGGQDYFTPAAFTEEFVSHIPSSTDTRHRYFPDAYHLLMYDDARNEVFAAISQWIGDKYGQADQIS
ncbi:monoacylglycerol lipase [Rubritalea halochordaticola]|uniref:Monoacylglycerol lipase n=1 Tax=Rubritalea halochordaticola TaxID=714537 RepID=A0ABP9UXM3_9BACT